MALSDDIDDNELRPWREQSLTFLSRAGFLSSFPGITYVGFKFLQRGEVVGALVLASHLLLGSRAALRYAALLIVVFAITGLVHVLGLYEGIYEPSYDVGHPGDHYTWLAMGLGVLVVTGSIAPPRLKADVEHGRVGALTKPFTQDELLSQVDVLTRS